MSSPRTTTQFDFNTVTTALPVTGEAPGRFDAAYHNKQLAPFFTELTAVDGIVEFKIGRSLMTIETFDKLISLQELLETIDRIVANMADLTDEKGGWLLFPNRGDQTPKATIILPESEPEPEPEPEQPTRLRWVHGTPNTHLTVFLPKGVTDSDEEAFATLIVPLAEAMTKVDGILDWHVNRTRVALKIDTEIISEEQVEKHMRAVFETAAQQKGEGEPMKDIFPFLTDPTKLEVVFTANNPPW